MDAAGLLTIIEDGPSSPEERIRALVETLDRAICANPGLGPWLRARPG